MEKDVDRDLDKERLRSWFVDQGIEMVIFDMDGTLVSTKDHFLDNMREYCSFLAEETDRDESELFNMFLNGVRTMRPEFSVQSMALEVPARVLARMCEVSGTRFEIVITRMLKKIYGEAPEVLPGAVEQVRMVRDAGVDTTLVTHAGEDWTLKKRQSFSGLFKQVVCTRTDMPKDIEAWKEALQELGVNPGKVMVVGDSLVADVQPSLELGVNRVVWINGGVSETKVPEEVIRVEEIGDLTGSLLKS